MGLKVDISMFNRRLNFNDLLKVTFLGKTGRKSQHFHVYNAIIILKPLLVRKVLI